MLSVMKLDAFNIILSGEVLPKPESKNALS